MSMSDDAGKLKFVADQWQFEYDLRGETLAKLGKAPPMPGPGANSPEQLQKMREVLGEERFREFMEKQKETGPEEGENRRRRLRGRKP